MANVLPQSFRDGIKGEYKLRLATVGLALLAVVLLAAIILMVPSFILTESRLKQKQTILNSLSSDPTSTSTQQSKKIITATNRKLSLISKETTQLTPTDIVSLITATKPSGVSVRRIAIQKAPDTSTHIVTLTGVAQTRDDLLEFENNISNQAQVRKVDLPIETLASQRNAEFSLTVTIKSL